MPAFRFVVTDQLETYGGPARRKLLSVAEVQSLLGVSAAPAGATTFTGLADVPSDYAGAAGQVVVVNGTEDGLEFSSISGSGLTHPQVLARGLGA